MSFNALPDALILVCLARHFAFEHSETGQLSDGWRLLHLRRFNPAQKATLKSHTVRIRTLEVQKKGAEQFHTLRHELSQAGLTVLVRQPTLCLRGRFVLYPWTVFTFVAAEKPLVWNEAQRTWVAQTHAP